MGRKRGSGIQTRRNLKLLALLQGRPRGMRVQELEETLSVSRSQLKRDLEVLARQGHDIAHEIESEAPNYRRVKLRRATLLPASASTSRGERFALLFWLAMMRVLDGTALEEDARSVFEKLTALLGPDERRDLRRLRARILYVPDGGVVAYGGKADVFDSLLTGVLNGRLVEGRHSGSTDADSGGGERADDALRALSTWAPLGFAYFRQRLYVVAAPVKTPGGLLGRPRLYACDRFTELDVKRGAGFEVPEGFSLASFFDGAFGIARGGAKRQRVVLDFDGRAARSIQERQWHSTQEAEPRPDGARGVRLAFTPSSLFEVPSWVLGWGDLVAVVEPAELRQRVIESHLRSLERHGLDVSAVRAQLGHK